MTQRSKSDTSALMKPLELASPLNRQILDARSTGTHEVVETLEFECDIILECRICRGLFRSLANFLAHKRVFCLDSFQDRSLSRLSLRQNPAVVVVQPRAPEDSDYDTVRSAAADPKKGLPHSAPPTRKPISLAQALQSQTQYKDVQTKPISGTAVAVTQKLISEDRQGATPAMSNDSDSITVVQPQDGYPNMNLRRRGAKKTYMDEDYIQYDNDSEEEARVARTKSKAPRPPDYSPSVSSLSSRSDCDVEALKCLKCQITYSSLKSLRCHMNNHHSSMKKVWPCVYCNTNFAHYWALVRHLKRLHNVQGTELEQLKHQIKYRLSPRAEIPMEMKQLSRIDKFDRQVVIKVDKSGANINSTSQQNVTTARSHKQTATAERRSEHPAERVTPTLIPDEDGNWRCDMCDKMFGRKQYFNQHRVACARKSGYDYEVLTQPEEKVPNLYVCKDCNCAFDKREKKEQHVCSKAPKKAAEKEPNESPEPSNENTSVEITSEDNEQQPTYECSLCHRVFGMKSYCVQHIHICKRRHRKTEAFHKYLITHEDGKKREEISDQKSVREKKLEKRLQKKRDSENRRKELKQLREEKEKEKITINEDDVLYQLADADIFPDSAPTDGNLKFNEDSTNSPRPKRNIKPKKFHDGTKVPEVVKVKQADGTTCYKLKEDVESSETTVIEVPASLPVKKPAVSKPPTVIFKQRASKVTGFPGGNEVVLDPEDQKKVDKLVDVKALTCLQCEKLFSRISNLKRHAVRHLGWKRYKCKICEFTSFYRSECKTHLRKTHSKDVSTLLDSGLLEFIIDLGADEEDEKTITEKSSTEKSATEKSSAEKSSAEKSSAETSSAETSSADKSSADKSPADKSSADKSSAEKTSSAIKQLRVDTPPVETTPPQKSSPQTRSRSREVNSTDPAVQASNKSAEKTDKLDKSKQEVVTPTVSSRETRKTRRGRPRKYESQTDTDTNNDSQDEIQAAVKRQDENRRKTSILIPTTRTLSPPAKMSRRDKEQDADKSNKLEGLLSRLKTSRKPLSVDGNNGLDGETQPVTS